MLKAALTVWRRPGDTIEAMQHATSGAQIFLLAALSGFSFAVNHVAFGGTPAHLGQLDVLAALLLLSVPIGLINVYLTAFAAHWMARRFGGTSTYRSVRSAVAWSNVPIIAGLLPSVGFALTAGTPIAVIYILLFLVLIVWFYGLVIAMLRRLEGFGTGRALAAFFLGCTLFIFLPAGAVRAFLVQSFSIASSSMEPTLPKDANVFAVKGVLAGPPARGDLVVFRLPSDPRSVYVKRVVGLAGDHIHLSHRILFINGEPVSREKTGDSRLFIRYRETLPGGPAFEAQDSVAAESAIDTTQDDLVPDGALFVLGDNRDNSIDSRFADKMGFVPVANIVGKVAVITYATGPQGEIAWNRIGTRPR